MAIDYQKAFTIVLDKVMDLEEFYENNTMYNKAHNRTCANLCCRIKDEMHEAQIKAMTDVS